MSEKMVKTLHCAFLVIVGIVFILPLLWVEMCIRDRGLSACLLPSPSRKTWTAL